MSQQQQQLPLRRRVPNLPAEEDEAMVTGFAALLAGPRRFEDGHWQEEVAFVSQCHSVFKEFDGNRPDGIGVEELGPTK